MRTYWGSKVLIGLDKYHCGSKRLSGAQKCNRGLKLALHSQNGLTGVQKWSLKTLARAFRKCLCSKGLKIAHWARWGTYLFSYRKLVCLALKCSLRLTWVPKTKRLTKKNLETHDFCNEKISFFQMLGCLWLKCVHWDSNFFFCKMKIVDFGWA